MFFMRSLSAAAPKASRPRAEGRSPRRRPAAFRLETLEARDLKSNIPGVSFAYGSISIHGTQSSGNSAHVSYSGSNVRVNLNGQVAEFNASQVYSVSYSGGQNGWDTFQNDTNLYTQMYGFGGYNRFYGGSGFNTTYLYGSSNTYDARGGMSYVFNYGTHSNISNYWNTYTYSYNTSNFYFI